MSPQGLITHDGREYTIRFERHLDHPVSRVWDALTRPALLVKWLAVANVDLRPEGDFILTFSHYNSSTNGKVVRIREYSLLEYTWREGQEQDSLLTWELFPQGPDACLLVLTHTRIIQNVPDFGAGWHMHLDLLAEVLSGIREAFTLEESETGWLSKRSLYGKGS